MSDVIREACLVKDNETGTIAQMTYDSDKYDQIEIENALTVALEQLDGGRE